MYLNYLASLSHYIPELILCALMVGLILLDSTYKESESNKKMLFSVAYIGLFVAFVELCLSLGSKPVSIFSNAVIIDPFSSFLKIIMVIGTAGAIYLSKSSKDIYSSLKAEFVIIAIGVLIGGMLLASANNMLILYIGIETLSILSYVLASLMKNDERSSEAGLKYSLYGGVTSGIMLFGLSHIFGVTGTIQFASMGETVAALSSSQLMILLPSFLFFFAGIGYKIASVPFHMWSPDVYEGSPLPVTAFFSIVPKMAGIAVLLRVTLIFFGQAGVLQASWVGVLMIAAALTMTVGNVSAIGQYSVKRMLAYSSISHAGVMMLGVLVIDDIGSRAILFYGLTYLFMTLIAFYITSFINDKYGNDHFDRFNGLISKHPLASIIMIITMFSLAGLPPLSGFVAKFNILSAIIAKKYFTLAVITALNSVVSLYYYMKIVRNMVFRPADCEEKVEGFNFTNQLILVAMCAPVLFLGIFWSKILTVADGAKIFIQQ